MNISTAALGAIITNPKVRKTLYAVVLLAALVAASLHQWFTALHLADPSWLVGASAVIVYLAVPAAGLALANVNPSTTVAALPGPVSADPVSADVGAPDPEPNAADDAPDDDPLPDINTITEGDAS